MSNGTGDIEFIDNGMIAQTRVNVSGSNLV